MGRPPPSFCLNYLSNLLTFLLIFFKLFFMNDKSKGKDQPIRKVSRLTGLNPHVIRVWEKRYGAVTPDRTQTNRRVYTEEDIERLQLLGYLTREGRRIGQVARLSLPELKELVDVLEKDKKLDSGDPSSAPDLMANCLRAVGELNPRELDVTLAKATIFMSPVVIIEKLIIPLLEELSQRVRQGRLRLVHERFAYSSLRPFLISFVKSYEVPDGAPQLISSTLVGQNHEFGALYLVSAAAATGWRATYIGPNLPAEEIGSAAHQLSADLVALHFQLPRNDARLYAELQTLRGLLPVSTKIVAVGSGAASYQSALDKIGAVTVASFPDLVRTLGDLNVQPTA